MRRKGIQIEEEQSEEKGAAGRESLHCREMFLHFLKSEANYLYLHLNDDTLTEQKTKQNLHFSSTQ